MSHVRLFPYDGIQTFLLDAEADLASLPTAAPGSKALVADGSKAWQMGPSGEWVEIKNSGGGEGGVDPKFVPNLIVCDWDSTKVIYPELDEAKYQQLFTDKDQTLTFVSYNAQRSKIMEVFAGHPEYNTTRNVIRWYAGNGITITSGKPSGTLSYIEIYRQGTDYKYQGDDYHI